MDPAEYRDNLFISRQTMKNDNLTFKIAHIGINCNSEENFMNITTLLQEMFEFSIKDGNSSAFLGPEIEVMKKPQYGECGHIGFTTNDLEKAINKFQNKGFKIRTESIKYDANQKVKFVYLEKEINGFAIHLVQE